MGHNRQIAYRLLPRDPQHAARRAHAVPARSHAQALAVLPHGGEPQTKHRCRQRKPLKGRQAQWLPAACRLAVPAFGYTPAGFMMKAVFGPGCVKWVARRLEPCRLNERLEVRKCWHQVQTDVHSSVSRNAIGP